MRTNFRRPSLTALAMAVRSAHMVEPRALFSILQPVNTEPSAHSSAALNYGGVRDATLEEYIQTFLASTEDTLAMNTEQLCQYLALNAPIVAICFERTETLYHRGVISGMEPTQDSLFYNMQNWTVELE